MRRAVFRGCLCVSSALACAVGASCSSGPDQSIRIIQNADSYTLEFRAREIEGLCYAPRSILFNGNLSLDGFDGVNRWTEVSADPAQVAGLDDILALERVKIGRRGIALSMPRDVVKRPFNVQFVAFPCGAPTVSKGGMGKMHIVSVAADLPPFRAPRTAGETSNSVRDDEMMAPR